MKASTRPVSNTLFAIDKTGGMIQQVLHPVNAGHLALDGPLAVDGPADAGATVISAPMTMIPMIVIMVTTTIVSMARPYEPRAAS